MVNAFFRKLRARSRQLRTAIGANVTITFALATVPMVGFVGAAVDYSHANAVEAAMQTFALATIPMVGFVGAAVDYSHANAVKAAMQMAADSTALMLSKNVASLNSTDLQTKATDYFKAMFPRTDASGLAVTATYNTTNGSQIVVNASSNVKTNFMGMMGFSSLRVAVDSQVKWGNIKLRVALALDTTG